MNASEATGTNDWGTNPPEKMCTNCHIRKRMMSSEYCAVCFQARRAEDEQKLREMEMEVAQSPDSDPEDPQAEGGPI